MRLTTPFVYSILYGMLLNNTGCRQTTTPPSHFSDKSTAITISDDECITISGDAALQTFHWSIRDGSDWMSVGKVEMQRLDSEKPTAPWSYTSNGSLSEQSFQEKNITYTLTTGVIRSKNLLFHRIRCDVPGMLHVSATLTPFTEIQDRQISNSAAPASQMWLLPFESEVFREDSTLAIRGEGELLLLWHRPLGNITTTWQTLLQEYDPTSGEHLDLSKVADRLQQEAALEDDSKK